MRRAQGQYLVSGVFGVTLTDVRGDVAATSRPPVITVLEAAWRAAGSPQTIRSSSAGSCARCGRDGAVCSTWSAVSKQFTAFDGWLSPGGSWLCQVCAWGYASGELRMRPFLVGHQPPLLQPLDFAAVVAALAGGPLMTSAALIVPLRPGRKHLLPSAAWGMVSLDDTRLSWSAADAGRLRILVELRQAGFGTRMLRGDAPAYAAIRALPSSRWAAIMAAWAELEPWRSPDNPWLELGLRITTPTDARPR